MNRCRRPADGRSSFFVIANRLPMRSHTSQGARRMCPPGEGWDRINPNNLEFSASCEVRTLQIEPMPIGRDFETIDGQAYNLITASVLPPLPTQEKALPVRDTSVKPIQSCLQRAVQGPGGIPALFCAVSGKAALVVRRAKLCSGIGLILLGLVVWYWPHSPFVKNL